MSKKTDIISLRPETDSQMQASKWLAKLDRGDLSAKEKADLSQWLMLDTTHRELLRDMTSFWYGLNEPLHKSLGLNIASNHTAKERGVAVSLLGVARKYFFTISRRGYRDNLRSCHDGHLS